MKKTIIFGILILILINIASAWDSSVTYAWKFNDSTTTKFYDHVDSFDLVPDGTVAIDPNYPTFAISGDGGNQSLNLADTGSLTDDGITIDMSQFSHSSGNAIIFFMNQTTAGTESDNGLFDFWRTSDNRIFYTVLESGIWNAYTYNGAGLDCNSVNWFAEITDSKWHSYVLNFNTTHWVAYIDTVLNGTAVCPYTLSYSGSGTDKPYFFLVHGGSQLPATVDNLMVINKTLSQAEIENFHNYGNITGGGGDITPPTITFIYPNSTYNDTYNDYNGSIMFTTNEYTNCSLNNSIWNMTSTNHTVFQFDNISAVPDAYYSVIATCNDTSGNQANNTIYFTVDTTYPLLITSFDGNNTNITIFAEYFFNYSDNNMLWSINITINGTLINHTENISSNSFNYSNTLNVTNWPYGVYNVSTTYCDAHTGEVLKQVWDTPKKTQDSIDFDGITITSDINAKEITYTEKIDRVSFCFEYDTPQEFILYEIPESMTYIDNPMYKGWFIDDNLKRWLDFEGEHDVRVVDNYVIVTPDKPQSKFCFNSIGELNCKTEDFIFYNKNRLVLRAKDLTNNSADIQNFTIIKDGVIIGNTTTGVYNLDNLTNTTHNVTVDAVGYELKSVSWNSQNQTEYYNFSLYTNNSISISIYDESQPTIPLLNTTTVTMTFSSASESFVNTTATGTFYIDNLNATTWEIQFSALNYSDRTYTVTVVNRTHQFLTVYLATEQTSIFTVSDYDSGELLENVSIIIYRNINGSWVAIDTTATDITGRTRISFVSDINYRFYLTKDDYEDLIFNLNPVLFDSYSIKMNKITSQENYMDYERINLLYSPKTFYNESINFSMIISSAFSELTNYGFIATFPGGTITNTGSNSIGEILTSQLNITNATYGDTVTIEYYYTTSIYGLRNFTAIYPISFKGQNETTMVSNQDRTYGLGIFERMLFVVVFIFIVVGISTLIGRPVEGFAFGLFLFGLFVYIGFIPIWSVLITILIGLILISAKGGL